MTSILIVSDNGKEVHGQVVLSQKNLVKIPLDVIYELSDRGRENAH